MAGYIRWVKAGTCSQADERGAVMTRITGQGLLFFGASALLVVVWLLFFLRLHQPTCPALVYVGWGILAGGLVLMVLAMRTLRMQGEPESGQDFTHTTHVVEHGIYAAVRHPLYLGWLLIGVAAMFFSQHWLVLLLALLGSGCLYGIAWLEDYDLIERFGPAYERYMQKVPRMNPAAGLLRILRRAEPK